MESNNVRYGNLRKSSGPSSPPEHYFADFGTVEEAKGYAEDLLTDNKVVENLFCDIVRDIKLCIVLEEWEDGR